MSYNYKGDPIPVGMGIGIVPVMIINYVAIYFFTDSMNQRLIIFLLAIVSVGFICIIDDLMGNKEVSGFKGHLGSLLRGELTTGGFKAIVGGLVALFLSILISRSILEILVNTLIISLFTNLLNLFDLRPGRAIKGYLFIGTIYMLVGITVESKYIFILIAGYCIAYLPYDLKCKAMLGDVGSNILGITLGIITALNFDGISKFLLLSTLILINLLCEKYSLTKIIENNSILNYIDKIGNSN